MKRNVDRTDRTLRFIAGLVIVAAGVYYNSWWGVVGALVIVTAAIRWCQIGRAHV